MKLYTLHIRDINVVAEDQKDAETKLYEKLVNRDYEITLVQEYEVV